MVTFGNGVRKGCSLQVLENTALFGSQNLCGEKCRINKSLQSREMPHTDVHTPESTGKLQSSSLEMNNEK